ncbi:MAG: hypothetical protein HY906_09850 [Deltaproteobacteria bacterium]|nr:hypothetical protein [Deltaproteobacteria bacterium]
MGDVATAMGLWRARGQRPVACRDGSGCWVVHEHLSYVRLPTALGAPDDAASRELHWHRFAPLVSYAEPAAADGHDANALFYVCSDAAYDVERLSRKARRDVRHGLRSVTVRRMDFDELARRGHPALADTCGRNRMAASTPVTFAADCRLRGRFATEAAWGAFADDEVCAWVTTHRVGANVDLGAVAMVWERRSLCATYALVYEVVRSALRDTGAAQVGYGLSSLQRESRAASLHQFKTWLGFEAFPVRRIFEPHPLLRPLVLRPLLDLAGRALARVPESRFTNKLRGALDLMRGGSPVAVATAGHAPSPTAPGEPAGESPGEHDHV